MITHAAWPLRLVTPEAALSALADAEGWVQQTADERDWLGLVTLTTALGEPLTASVWLMWRPQLGIRKARHALVGATMVRDDSNGRALASICLVDRRVLLREMTPMPEHPHTRASASVLEAVAGAKPDDDVVPLILSAWHQRQT